MREATRHSSTRHSSISVRSCFRGQTRETLAWRTTPPGASGSFVIGGEYHYRRLFKEIAELGTRDLNFVSVSIAEEQEWLKKWPMNSVPGGAAA